MPDVKFHLCMIGPSVSHKVDGASYEMGSSADLSVTLHRGLYHEVFSSLSPPDIVIGMHYCSVTV